MDELTLELIDIGSVLPPDGDFKNYIRMFREAQDPSVEPSTVLAYEDWDDYEPPSPLIKNSTRFIQFQEHVPISSPDMPEGELSYISTGDQPGRPDGYTWGLISYAQSAMWPYHSEEYEGLSRRSAFHAGLLTTTPPEGALKVSNNLKCQALNFWANQEGGDEGKPLLRFKIFDPNGNGYVMHTAASGSVEEIEKSFDAAVLPKGWTKKKVELEQDLELLPARGEGGDHGVCHYNLVRDSSDNAYHQFQWSDNGIVVNAQIPDMVIWGGLDNNFITGDHSSSYGAPDTIHGAQGDDHLLGRTGSDQLWGDEGNDHLRGGSGHDDLIGGEGADRLYGGSGRDTLNGGGGNDVLRGGSGADRYHFSEGRDRVKGFSFAEGDRVVGAYEDVTAHRKGDDLILASGEQVLVLLDVGPLSVSDVFLSI